MDLYQQAAEKIDAIEAELKHLGRWSATPPSREAFDNMGAFGLNTMPFEAWIQFVLIPNVRAIITSKGAFPATSAVGVQAMREFDGDREADALQKLLSEFDALFGS